MRPVVLNKIKGLRVSEKREQRLAGLDGLRALAIALVIGFHYFARWTPPLDTVNRYPYGDAWAHFAPFVYGYLGVNVFFMISGFVISMTLVRSSNFLNFAYKRFARLFPSMLLCSTLTYLTLRALPQTAFLRPWWDFLPSLTFTEPYLWSFLTHRHFASMDGAYWSLVVEVKFYFWIAVLYFGLRARNLYAGASVGFGVLMVVLFAMHRLALPHQWVVEDVFVTPYLPWFVAGVGFHALHRGSRYGWVLLAQALLALSLPGIVDGEPSWPDWIAFAGGSTLFFALLYRPAWVALLAAPALAGIGEASYSLYLLHQEIGVAVLQLLDRSPFFLAHRWAGAGVAVALALGMACLAWSIYRYWEAPAKSWLLRLPRSPLIARAGSPVPPVEPGV